MEGRAAEVRLVLGGGDNHDDVCLRAKKRLQRFDNLYDYDQRRLNCEGRSTRWRRWKDRRSRRIGRSTVSWQRGTRCDGELAMLIYVYVLRNLFRKLLQWTFNEEAKSPQYANIFVRNSCTNKIMTVSGK